ncbi:MAG TPA: CvpA family protein, partial [Magnetospirillaceae bacterium]|nr:CvpA family protein [Magnetospirillaceae bacterium]
LVSGVFALMRGFVYEVLAMAGWVLAALAALWGLPYIRPLIAPHISNATIADVAGGAAIFLVVLLVSSFITHSISRQVRKSAVSAVDRSLGFAFGLVRGLVLASLCYMVVDKLTAPDEPAVLAAAKTRPMLAAGSRLIQSLIPGHSDIEGKAKAAAEAAAQAAMFNQLSAPKPKSNDELGKDKTPSYDRSGLERLIETTGKDKDQPH